MTGILLLELAAISDGRRGRALGAATAGPTPELR